MFVINKVKKAIVLTIADLIYILGDLIAIVSWPFKHLRKLMPKREAHSGTQGATTPSGSSGSAPTPARYLPKFPVLKYEIPTQTVPNVSLAEHHALPAITQAQTPTIQETPITKSIAIPPVRFYFRPATFVIALVLVLAAALSVTLLSGAGNSAGPDKILSSFSGLLLWIPFLLIAVWGVERGVAPFLIGIAEILLGAALLTTTVSNKVLFSSIGLGSCVLLLALYLPRVAAPGWVGTLSIRELRGIQHSLLLIAIIGVMATRGLL